jgi:hypothetical protein
MVPKRPPWRKHHASSGCMEYSIVLPMLDFVLPNSSKDMRIFTHIRFSLDHFNYAFWAWENQCNFCLIWGTPFTFEEADFHKMKGREIDSTMI